MISASKLELAMTCPGAFTLPQLDERNEWSDAGNVRHEAKEEAADRGEVDERIATRWPNFTWRAEVAFAFDVSTGEGRELGAGIGRDYARFDPTPFEVVGTADLVGIRDGGNVDGPALVIVDYKGFEVQAPAAQHAQVRFLALAAARAHGAATTEVAISPEMGPLDVAALDAFDLDETAHQTRQVMLDVAKAQHDARNGLPVPFVESRACRWCAAFHACPKKQELRALVVSGQADQRVEMTMPFRNDEEAADMLALSKRIGILKKRIDSALYARATEKPFAVGDGRMFGPVEKQGSERLDGDITYQAVKAMHGQVIADAAVERKASKSRLKEALAFAIGKGGMAAAERKVLDEVRRLGGAKRETTIAVVEYTPQSLLRVVP